MGNGAIPEVADDELLATYPEVISAYQRACLEIAHSGPGPLDEFTALVGAQLCDLLHLRRHAVYLRGDDGDFHARVYERQDGVNTSIGQQTVHAGDPLHRRVIRTRQPLFIADARNDPRLPASTIERWGLRSMLYVPMTLGEKVVGVIHLDAAEATTELSATALKTAQAFASLCALAVHQAGISARLEQHAHAVDSQKDLLKRLSEIHDELVGSVLDGADLRGTLTLLANLLGNPTVLYSTDLRPVLGVRPGGASIVLTAPGFEMPRGETLGRALDTRAPDQPSILVAPASEGGGHAGGCLLAPLMADKQLIGYLGVLERAEPLTPLAVRAAEQASTAIALQMLIEQRQAESRGQAREDLLGDLLYGERDPDQLERRALLFDLDLRTPHVLLHITRDRPRPSTEERAWLLNRLDPVLGPAGLLHTTTSGGIVLLIPADQDSGPEPAHSITRRVQALLGELPTAGWTTPLALSTVCHHPAQYPDAFADLRSVVTFGRLFGLTHVLTPTNTGLLRLILNGGGPAKANRFARELLQPLEHADPALSSTLRAYLDNQGRIRATARQLAVHENTIRYRLNKIRNLTGCNLENLDGMLNARVAVQITDMQPGR
ncbi:helix-turn-helix domain-containing protein [Streptomyces sp. NPDC057199]|uniref:helix-turn-helix domain-containing protein n=1 Tax=Streptomyces sp. NPDC057199 TaxID=3346047 RepID=UPI003640B965